MLESGKDFTSSACGLSLPFLINCLPRWFAKVEMEGHRAGGK